MSARPDLPPVLVKTEDEFDLITKAPFGVKNSSRVHPKKSKKKEKEEEEYVRPNRGGGAEGSVDFWQNIAAIEPESATVSEFEPLGLAMVRGNQESNARRFGFANKDINLVAGDYEQSSRRKTRNNFNNQAARNVLTVPKLQFVEDMSKIFFTKSDFIN